MAKKMLENGKREEAGWLGNLHTAGLDVLFGCRRQPWCLCFVLFVRPASHWEPTSPGAMLGSSRATWIVWLHYLNLGHWEKLIAFGYDGDDILSSDCTMSSTRGWRSFGNCSRHVWSGRKAQVWRKM